MARKPNTTQSTATIGFEAKLWITPDNRGEAGTAEGNRRNNMDAADNIVGGPAFSTLSNDPFRSRTFDFMLANPPYRNSWKSDLERMSGEGSKKGVKDPRFLIEHAGVPAWNEIAVKVMKENHVAIDDLYVVILPQQAKTQRPKDVHFDAKGSAILADPVRTSIEACLPER